MDQNLTQLRDQIDGIDQKLVELFKQRMAVSREVAAYKQEHGLPTLDAGRERALLAKVGSLAGEDLADYTESVFRSIMAASRSYQKQCEGSGSPVYEGIRTALSTTPDLFPQRATVACQGIEGGLIPRSPAIVSLNPPTILYFDTFDHVFKAVESGMCQYGILPIENSTAGSVNATYDLMTRHNFSIVRSARLKVSHNLLAKAGTGLPDIKEVFSHEQAINQCSAFLSGLKGVKVTVVPNTAVAARMVSQSERRDVAALSSRFCGKTYGLELLRVQCAEPGQQLYPLHLYLPKAGDLSRGRPNLSDDDPATQAGSALPRFIQVLRPGHQPAKAGEPPPPGPGV
ncbi:MAG: prephenate dehydratase domain-containing protein [Oscillospiraceae bacterium]